MSEPHNFLTEKSGLAQGVSPGKESYRPFSHTRFSTRKDAKLESLVCSWRLQGVPALKGLLLIGNLGLDPLERADEEDMVSHKNHT